MGEKGKSFYVNVSFQKECELPKCMPHILKEMGMKDT